MARGRPSTYRPEFAAQATKLCLLGATDEELASFFGVRRATIANWKKRQPDFIDAIKNGKSGADANIAASLYRRGIGYEKNGKHIPGDTTACIFWLKNRRADLWRDRAPDSAGPQ